MSRKKTHLNKKKKKKKEYEHGHVGSLPKIEKKKVMRDNVQEERKKKKKSRATWTSPCAIARGHFCPKIMSNFSLQFSLHFGENFLVGPKRTPESHNLFSFLPT